MYQLMVFSGVDDNNVAQYEPANQSEDIQELVPIMEALDEIPTYWYLEENGERIFKNICKLHIERLGQDLGLLPHQGIYKKEKKDDV